MAGIYIHIPFCRQACHYCDFHFSTSLKNKKDFLDALKKEIVLQKDYLKTKKISTVYFGGGTPSILSKEEILCLVDELSKYFSIDSDAEITLEANPDDLSKEKLKELFQTPVNRLSIGIQSFSNEDLKFLNRIHNSQEAIESVRNAQDAGFKNISIDLIYGIQTLTNKRWKKNLHQAFELSVQHISCYALTVEPRTSFYSFIKKGKIKNIDSKKSAEQFEILMREMEKHKFVHYEISNFAAPKGENKKSNLSALPLGRSWRGLHNSNYWKGENYLGLGPSAHSYNADSRQWNVSSNSAYINSLKKNMLPFEKEGLSENQKYNEYILTSLRTMWGTDLNYVKVNFRNTFSDYLSKQSQKHISSGELVRILNPDQHPFLLLTPKGKLFADKIACDLFFIAD